MREVLFLWTNVSNRFYKIYPSLDLVRVREVFIKVLFDALRREDNRTAVVVNVVAHFVHVAKKLSNQIAFLLQLLPS